MTQHERGCRIWAISLAAAGFGAGMALASPEAGPAQVEGSPGLIIDVPAALKSPVVRPQSRPDFSGHWKIDAGASDDPQERLKQAMRQSTGDAPGMHGGGGTARGGGMGGKRHKRGSQQGMGARSEVPFDDRAELLAPANTLDITHEEPMLLIADENGRRQRLFTDFRSVSVSAAAAQPQAAVAGWEGDVLVVESRMNHGSRRVQQYRIDAETGRLMISSTVELPNLREVSFRLVYERLTSPPDAGRKQAADGS